MPQAEKNEKVIYSLKEKAISGLLWGGLSNLFQQFLGLLFGIVLARLLSPAEYGMVGLLTIFSLIASSLQEGGFVSALANKEIVTHRDYNAVFWTSILISLGLYLIFFFLAPSIAAFFNTPELTILSRFLFLNFVIASIGTAHNAYLFRNLKVKEKAISTTVALAFSGLIGIVLAYLGYSYWGLAAQSVSYISMYTILMWRYSEFRPTFEIDLKPVSQLIGYSSKVLVSNVFNHINNNIFSVILGRFYDKANVGYFSQAFKWSNMGQSVIANMSHGFSQPMLSSLSNDQERQKRVFLKMLNLISCISFPALLCLGISADEFIIITLTEKWIISAGILRILCLSAALLPLINLYTNFILSKGKSNIYMYNIIAFGLVQLMAVMLIYPYGISAIAFAIVAVNFLWLLIWQYYVSDLLQVRYLTILKDVMQYLILALISAGIALYFGSFNDNIYIRIIIKSFVLTGVYVSLLYFIKSEILHESYVYLKNKVANKKI